MNCLIPARAGTLLIGTALLLAAPTLAAAQEGEATEQTLTVANSVELPTFDPQRVLGIDAIVAVANLYDRLVYLDAEGAIQPWLATSWELSDDGRTWTFKLREDATFHDGSPVTSEAVKYSFERATGPDSPSSLAKTYLASIVEVETPDEHTVVLRTEEPFAPLLNHLGHQTVGVILNPAVVEEKGGDLSTAVDAGGGMYRLVSWDRNSELVLERNDDWWGPAPAYKRIVYKPVPQASTRVVMLENGEVDVVTSIPSFEVMRLEGNADIEITPTESIRSMYFAFNMENKDLEDVRVRQALNHAVDVDGIIAALLDGHGTRARSVITPNLPYYSPAYDFDYDPDQARALLEEAGIESGTRFRIISPQGRWPMDAEVAQAVAGNLRDLGLDVDLQIIGDWAQYQQTLRNGDFHLGMNAWAPGSLDADGTFSTLTLTGGSNNYGRYSSERADELVLEGARNVDSAKREGIYRELQDLLGTEVPYLLLYNGVSFSAKRSTACGVNVRSDEAVLIKDAHPC